AVVSLVEPLQKQLSRHACRGDHEVHQRDVDWSDRRHARKRRDRVSRRRVHHLQTLTPPKNAFIEANTAHPIPTTQIHVYTASTIILPLHISSSLNRCLPVARNSCHMRKQVEHVHIGHPLQSLS